MVNIIFLFILFIFLLWVVCAFIVNDFSLPSRNIRKYKRILVIFPHADDEVSHTAGLFRIAEKYGNKTTWVILTKGERGTPNARLDNNLKAIRTKEALEGGKIYCVTKLIQEDFGDGQLSSKRKELTTYTDKTIKNEHPDLIITYDLAGEYGHPDHIIVSEIITDLVKNKYKNIHLWYATYPKLIYNMATFPIQMAKDPNFMKRRSSARFKIFIGLNLIQKVRAVYVHKSQYKSFQKAIPYHIPPWFAYSLFICEYFSEAN